MIYLLWRLKFSGCNSSTTKSSKVFHKELKVNRKELQDLIVLYFVVTFVFIVVKTSIVEKSFPFSHGNNKNNFTFGDQTE
ncbi:MAG: hypothetical protein C0397_18570 [Odoribacter sp.]|nr:hypothetical protein [Odoribacter sp.]